MFKSEKCCHLVVMNDSILTLVVLGAKSFAEFAFVLQKTAGLLVLFHRTK